eukprot:gb/GECG01004976.1/.p1 GENE.gb/GECG01004976.1/~~gb/GECG01004976.1/.p1  ORF type:complete len:156 (+),score=23.84 gb/GECG01004976.1/:1-468(+)
MATESKPSASGAAGVNTGNAKEGDQDNVTLLSQENTRFVVPREQAELSGLVKTMTEDEGNEEEVPLMDVRADVLKKVIEFCRHHTTEGHPIKEIEKPLPSSNLASIVSEWDANFVDVDQETLFDLILVCYVCLVPSEVGCKDAYTCVYYPGGKLP